MGRLGIRVLVFMAGALMFGVPAASALPAPTPPSFVNSVSNMTTLSGATGVAVSGNYAYTPSYFGGTLTAINISNPATPTVAGESASASSLFGGSTVNIANGYAYVASKNMNGPCLPGPAPACSMSLNDNGTGDALTILDIHTNPAVPAIVGTVQDTTACGSACNLFGANGISVSGNYAYVASQGLIQGQPSTPNTSTGSFSVIDVTNPATASVVAHLDNGSLAAPWNGSNALEHADGVFVSGNYAYVTSAYSDRLTIINISNPLAPYIVSSLQDGTNLVDPSDITVVGNYAYITNQTGTPGNGNLTIVNVSNPVSPQVVGALSNTALAGAYRVRVHGDFAYVAGSSQSTIGVVDISNPANPLLAGYVQSPSGINTPLGLDLTSNGYIMAGSVHAMGETTAKYAPYNQTTGTIASIQIDPVPNTVTIDPTSEPASSTRATSASFTFGTSDQIATVRCQIDGAALGFCTTPTTAQYSGLSLGSHTFTVQTTDAMGNVASATYTWTITAAPAAVRNTSLPVITGADTIGQKLTCSTGGWTGTPPISYSYRWTADGNVITNATSSTYVIQPSDAGQFLGCQVHATNAAAGGQTAISGTFLPPPAGAGSSGTAKALANGAVKVTVTCASNPAHSGCRLSLRLIVRRKVVASKLSFPVRAGKHATIKLTLSRATLKLLTNAKKHKLSAILTLTETGTNGKVTTVSIQRLTLTKR